MTTGSAGCCAPTRGGQRQLADLGFEVLRLTREPIQWPVATKPFLSKGGPAQKSAPDPRVAAMLATIQATNLYAMVARLSGAEPVLAGGKPQVIASRNTTSGLPLTNALETAFARFEALGLQPAYQSWANGGYNNRNLSATLPGGAHSNELVLITAHLDNRPYATTAPGRGRQRQRLRRRVDGGWGSLSIHLRTHDPFRAFYRRGAREARQFVLRFQGIAWPAKTSLPC